MHRIPVPLALSALFFAVLTAPAATAEIVTYELIVNNTWSAQTHPNVWEGIESPHFSHLGGVSHNDQVSFWALGQLATPGVKLMAETGWVDHNSNPNDWNAEFQAAVDAGTAHAKYVFPQWFPAPSVTRLTIEVSDTHPLVTFATMLGPSPDWFVGVSALSLRDPNGWIDEVIVQLPPHDGGTRDNNIFQLFGPLTTPPDPIQLIATPPLGPDSLGTFTFRRICTDGDLTLPVGVDLPDFAFLHQYWMASDCGDDNDCNGADINQSDMVDMSDAAVLLQNWLDCR